MFTHLRLQSHLITTSDCGNGAELKDKKGFQHQFVNMARKKLFIAIAILLVAAKTNAGWFFGKTEGNINMYTNKVFLACSMTTNHLNLIFQRFTYIDNREFKAWFTRWYKHKHKHKGKTKGKTKE